MQKKKQQTQKSKKTDIKFVWKEHQTLIWGDGGTTASEKIASFDMDWTMIRTKSGAQFPKNADDWLLWDDHVAPKLQQMYKEDYKIVIFSNQGGISTGKQKGSDIKTKIENISKEIGVPMQAFLSTTSDSFRKPAQGMWEYFTKNCNDGVKVDMKASVYVGDAAGRKPPQVKKKDFSDSDFKFAACVGLPFQTPEQYFQGCKEKIKITGWNPATLGKSQSLFKEKDAVLKLGKQEMIINCGSSSAGKSTFTTTHLSDYERINRDTLKTKEKCYKVAEQAIQNKKSVVIDNTNPSVQDRAYFLKLAQQYDIPARCFYFSCEKDQCFFLNEQRIVNSNRTHLSGKVPALPIHTFFKNHEPPKVSEGFQSVQTINFVSGPFKNADDERSFFVYGK